ncbi:MAG: hypothetical protein HY695_29925 [Deltaproteobacteria bacterium]|nr:hypothetical protein [Deltaproteobacteria bacterium]
MATARARSLEIPDAPNEAFDWFVNQRMTDGLPVIPPTEERVDAVLGGTRRERAEEIGLIPPRWASGTVEKLAINAVMAGCLPEYMPVLLAAVEALLDPRYNVYGTQATTHPGAPMVIVHGPAAKQLQIASGSGCFGPGYRPNLTIGRAIRLFLVNVGGSLPTEGTMSTFGWPGRYSFCWAEAEEASPWSPYHADKGFDANQSAVTVAHIGGFTDIHDPYSKSAPSLLKSLAYGMTSKSTNIGGGGNPACVLSPAHARLLAREGVSKTDVRKYLCENARAQPRRLGMESVENFERTTIDSEGLLRIADEEEGIQILVAGGEGPHSAGLFTWGRESLWVTKAVQ